MAQLIKVRPSRPDLIVLDQNSRRIPYKEKGVQVKRTPHIVGRINEGDLVVIVEAPKALTPSTPKKKTGGDR